MHDHDINSGARRAVARLSAPWPLLFFLAASSLKVALFRMSLVSDAGFDVLYYAFFSTFLLQVLLYATLPLLRWRWLFTGFYLAQVAYLFSFMIYYVYAHRYLHLTQLFTQGREGIEGAGALWLSLETQQAIVLLDLPFFVWLWLTHAETLAWQRRRRRWVLKLAAIAALLIAGVEVQNDVIKKSLRYIVADKTRGEVIIVRRYGTLINSLIDLYRGLNEQRLVAELQYGSSRHGEGASGTTSHKVLMIQVESMDAYMIGMRHHGTPVMPFLTELSEHSIYYPYALSYHAGGATSDCEFSSINGIEPFESFAALKLRHYDYPNSFVRQLTQAGLSTQAFHNNQGDYFNRRTAFSRMGYRRFWDIHDMDLPIAYWGASDKNVRRFVAERLRRQRAPFFFHWITMTSHGPFKMVRPLYHDPLFDDVKDVIVRDYFNSLAYVDRQLKALIQTAQATQPEATILIFGDHSSAIRDPDYPPSTLTIGDDRLEFVPYFILTPGRREYRETQRVASFLDTGVTVLEAAGVEYEVRSFGTDLGEPPIDSQRVRYKGRWHDRRELFEAMERGRKTEL